MSAKKTTFYFFFLSSALGLALLAGGIALYLGVSDLPETTGEPRPEESSGPEEANGPKPGDGDTREKELPQVLGKLARAVARNDAAAVRGSAQRTRDWLEEDHDRIGFVGDLLVDVNVDQNLRVTLAWILGSLDSDVATRSLLTAIATGSVDTTTLRWFVYALGIWNEKLTRKNRFDFSPESPWVVECPTGIRVPIARRITDKETVSALAPLLGHDDIDLRKAAIASSRHSLNFSRLRETFRQQLPAESDAGNRANLGEALAAWARTSAGSSEEAVTVVSEILRESRVAKRDLLRLKAQPDLKGVPMESSHLDTLKRSASGIDGDEFTARQFALEVLGSQTSHLENSQSGKFDNIEIQDFFLDLVKSDSHPKLRETTVRQLARIPGDRSAEALMDALDQDPAWNVRYAAARELGTLHSGSSSALVRTALKGALLHDQDSRVQEAARRSLKSKLPSTD